MTYCPSQDWDRYVDDQERAAAEGVAWWANPHHQLLVATLLAGRISLDATPDVVRKAVDQAGLYAAAITSRGLDPDAEYDVGPAPEGEKRWLR